MKLNNSQEEKEQPEPEASQSILTYGANNDSEEQTMTQKSSHSSHQALETVLKRFYEA